MTVKRKYDGLEIAIIGISAQFPGSIDYRAYWDNLSEGKDLIKRSTDEELLKAGLAKDLVNDELYVRSFGSLDNKDFFDNNFFDYNSEEATYMDPQIRLFHEHCWKALEDAGYSSIDSNNKIGLFAGAAENVNWRAYVYSMHKNYKLDPFYIDLLASEKYLTTLVSYKLNLLGPSLNISTACSTSLVAVNSACKSLLTRECNLAIAGGVSISTIKQKGYYYQEGMIKSKDGFCRAFDKDASGTIVGEGVGVVILKRLSDAIKDNDNIYAIIKGSAVNNDGAQKVGYTAPSVNGQADCIKRAHKIAGVESQSIGYIETHGTATVLGDPIEIEALNNAFNNEKEKFCAIGSVKTNIGHVDAAAGVAGLIKAVLSIKNKKIPASLHFNEPNPEINFNNGPFYVNTKLTAWEAKNNLPLRAGVSSFGIGGTNAHVVIEEAPEIEKLATSKTYKLLCLSAKTPRSLERYIDNFKKFLNNEPDVNLEDLAFTFQVGRKHFECRRSFVFKDRIELLDILNEPELKNPITVKSKETNWSTVFMFPGQGSQYVNMGKDLYLNNSFFKDLMDKGFEILEQISGKNFKEILYPVTGISTEINNTYYTQPLIFLFEFSMAKLIMSLGVKPKYMIGHSIGEYAAACLSDVFSFEEALKIVLKRGELMGSLPTGSMLSVFVNEAKAIEFQSKDISIAAINSANQVVFSGSDSSISELIKKLDNEGLTYIKLHTSHAFHSSMQDAIVPDFLELLATVKFNKPSFPFVSNLTGNLIKNDEATSKDYWAQHMRQTVKFEKGITALCNKKEDLLFIEVGSGNSLSGLVKQAKTINKALIVNLINHPKENTDAVRYFTEKLGYLWNNGINIAWNEYYKGEIRRRISLPTYSFETIQYPTEVDPFADLSLSNLTNQDQKNKNINEWLYQVQWKQSNWLTEKYITRKTGPVLIFSNNLTPNDTILQKIYSDQTKLIKVLIGEKFEKKDNAVYFINPLNKADYENLFSDLKENYPTLSNIIHFWNFDNSCTAENFETKNDYYQQIGYYSLLNTVRSFSNFFSSNKMHISTIGNGWFNVFGNETICPAKATSLGAAKVIPLEFPNITCKSIDIADVSDDTLNSLIKELKYDHNDSEVAIRGNRRYEKYFDKIKFEVPENKYQFKQKGTYLITGANGGMGKVFSDFLAKEFKANLILISRGIKQNEFINTLEKEGAKVFYIQGDISDTEAISKQVQYAESLFGNINGVIHAAGIADLGGVIVRRENADDEKVFSPKVSGTKTLTTIFKNKKPDFFINCSALAATLGAFGQVGYVAANLYQDAIAEVNTNHYPIISIEWTSLQETGMAVNSLKHLSAQDRKDRLRYGIDSSEAIAVLNYALYLGISNIIVSTTELHKILDASISNKDDEAVGFQLQDRPLQSVNYEAPVSETEIKLTQLVETFLGFKNIGVLDDFYELGGDSLKAMVILRKIKVEFGIDIGIKEFMEYSNIKQISEYIEEKLWINSKSEKKFGSII